MAKKDIMQGMKLAELQKMVGDLKKDLREMRFNRVLGSTFSVLDFKMAKKKLARVLTALGEQERVSAGEGK